MTNIDLTSRERSWFRWLPGLALLRSYQPAWLPRDLIAGLVLTTMLAPVGVAYAVASGVGPIYGLYATVACLLAYAVFGPSRILVLGPDSSLATIIVGVIAPLSAGDPGRAVALASIMALVSGSILVVARIAEFFKDRALDAVAKAPTPVRWLVVAAEPVTSVDVTAADVLSELNESLRAIGVKLAFAELKDPVKDKLKRFGIFDQFGEGFFFATVGAAVDAYQGGR
jgi:MFS superfamily sulfate permease-like transporter